MTATDPTIPQSVVLRGADEVIEWRERVTLPQNVSWAVKGAFAVPLFDLPPPSPRAADPGTVVDRALKASCSVTASAEGTSRSIAPGLMAKRKNKGVSNQERPLTTMQGIIRRIVFVSGTTELPGYTEFFQETSVPVLSKPFHVDMLLRFVKQCLQVLG